jgi:hypothetical protein
MDTGDLAIKILQVIAWPIAVVLIVFVLKTPIGKAILTVSKFCYKDRHRDVEVDFAKGLSEAESKAREIPTLHEKPVQSSSLETRLFTFSLETRLFTLARTEPRAAVTMAWLEVEASVYEAAQRLGLPTSQPRQKRQVLRTLASKGIINEAAMDLYEQLRNMRNEAAHALGFEIDPIEAEQYVELALNLGRILKTER